MPSRRADDIVDDDNQSVAIRNYTARFLAVAEHDPTFVIVTLTRCTFELATQSECHSNLY